MLTPEERETLQVASLTRSLARTRQERDAVKRAAFWRIGYAPDPESPAVERSLLTIAEVAEIMRVSTRAVHRWVQTAKVGWCRTPGGHVRIYRASLIKAR